MDSTFAVILIDGYCLKWIIWGSVLPFCVLCLEREREREREEPYICVKAALGWWEAEAHFPCVYLTKAYMGDGAGAGGHLWCWSDFFIIFPKARITVHDLKLKACNPFCIDVYIKGTTIWALMWTGYTTPWLNDTDFTVENLFPDSNQDQNELHGFLLTHTDYPVHHNMNKTPFSCHFQRSWGAQSWPPERMAFSREPLGPEDRPVRVNTAWKP